MSPGIRKKNISTPSSLRIRKIGVMLGQVGLQFTDVIIGRWASTIWERRHGGGGAECAEFARIVDTVDQ
jgi:hypothetical protein